MPTVYLLLGADLGNKVATFEKATARLTDLLGRLTAKSSMCESKAWGFESDMLFLNQVLRMDTALSPEKALDVTLQVEAELGRTRLGNGYESRTIDIDILFYDSIALSTERLSIPHPLLHERMFSLVPLCELAPDFIHPTLNKSIAELKASCVDKSEVRKIK